MVVHVAMHHYPCRNVLFGFLQAGSFTAGSWQAGDLLTTYYYISMVVSLPAMNVQGSPF
jgi:hypothetical protein